MAVAIVRLASSELRVLKLTVASESCLHFGEFATRKGGMRRSTSGSLWMLLVAPPAWLIRARGQDQCYLLIPLGLDGDTQP